MGAYQTYKLARKYLSKAEMTSDLASDVDYGRGKRKKIQHAHESSDTSEEESFPQGCNSQKFHTLRLPKFPDPNMAKTKEMTKPSEIVNMASSQGSKSVSVLNGKDKDFQATVLRDLFWVKAVVRQNREKLDSILEILSTMKENKCEVAVPNLYLHFPLFSMEQVEEVESKLVEPEYHQSLVKLLQVIGGISFENCVRRILRKLMVDQVANKFSWMGCKGKRPFSTLRASKAVFDAIKSNALFEKKLDSDIEFVIKNWLRHAKARCKNVNENVYEMS